MTNKISALTFNTTEDGWETSQGFIKREIEMPVLDEVKNSEDALSVILEIQYAGVCGSDRGIWYRNAFRDLIANSLKNEGSTQRILGHEFVGKIVEAGSQVSHLYNIQQGQLVSGDSHVTCGNCYQCKIGQNNVCTKDLILGISTNGIFAEYVKIPAKNLWPVNKDIRPEVAAILDPLGNAVHAVSKFDAKGKTVAVFGTGPIGLFAILFLKHFGASRIIAVDVNEKNLDLALRCGASDKILIEKDSSRTKAILELTKGMGVDVAMEMAGPASSVVNALESVRRGGEVVLFGIKDGDFSIPKFSTIITKGLTIYGVIGRRIFETWETLDRVLSDKSNGVQDKIWNVILKEGKGTIIDFATYDKKAFEVSMNENAKVILKFK